MKTLKKCSLSAALVFSIIGLDITNVLAATIDESLESGTAVDLYRVTCNARCVRANISDSGPFHDTTFKVLVSGSSNGFTGNSSKTNNIAGPPSPGNAEVCSPIVVNAQRRAYISFTEVNATGFENYHSDVFCRTVAGSLINPTIVKVLDQ